MFDPKLPNIEVTADLTEPINKVTDASLPPLNMLMQTITDIWGLVLGDRLYYAREKKSS